MYMYTCTYMYLLLFVFSAGLVSGLGTIGNNSLELFSRRFLTSHLHVLMKATKVQTLGASAVAGAWAVLVSRSHTLFRASKGVWLRETRAVHAWLVDWAIIIMAMDINTHAHQYR